MRWVFGKFLNATVYSVEQSDGYLYKGLALRLFSGGSPKGRRPPTWKLIHIGSGHGIAVIKATHSEAQVIACQLADNADWTFSGLRGYKNTEPDLPEIVTAWKTKHAKNLSFFGRYSNEETASSIAASIA